MSGCIFSQVSIKEFIVLENLNHSLFLLINATPETPHSAIVLATLAAKYLVLLFPLVAAGYWLCGAPDNMPRQRRFVCKSAVTLLIGLTLSWIIGTLYPHARPFAEPFGYSFLEHAPTPSFPSNHGIIVFTFTLSCLFWGNLRTGLLLLIPALIVAWSRVFLGVHWPVDMLGALITVLIACALTELLWSRFGQPLQNLLQSLYRRCFALPIRKGWVQR